MVKTRRKRRNHTARKPRSSSSAHAPAASGHALAQSLVIVPAEVHRGPRQMLADPDKLDSPPVFTTDPTKAKVYSDRSGAFKQLRRMGKAGKALRYVPLVAPK